MQYGIEVVPVGPYSDPRAVVRIAEVAESAGWDALSMWDHLVFPYGAGDPWVSLSALDEGLDLLVALLSGDEVTYRGTYYAADEVRVLPTPLQRPRVPVWIGGASPAALRRVARWDGWVIGAVDEVGHVTLPPEVLAEHVDRILGARDDLAPVDVAVTSISEPGDASRAHAYAAAGATWWFESLSPSRGSETEMLERVAAGPPSA